jgi:hypothetical protein
MVVIMKPYDDGDRLSEQEFAARIRKSVRLVRLWRQQRVGPPYSMNGKTPEYSWTKYLEYRAANEVHPVRSGRRAESSQQSA